MIDNWIPIKDVFYELKRNKLLSDLTLEMVINDAIAFQRRWDCVDMFDKKIAVIKCDGYRAQLPCDCYKLVAARDAKSQVMYRTATNIFHGTQAPHDHDFTYKIQNNIIISSYEDRPIEILYIAVKTDDDGLPMVWDNQHYIDALKGFIKEKVYTDLFDEGRINGNSLQQAKQDYAFEAKMLQHELTSINPDEARSISNLCNQMIPMDSWFESMFGEGNNNNFKFC